jgi:hypothetical protein
MTTPRQQRTAAFEAELEQEWSEYYFNFMTGNDGDLFYLDPEAFSANPNISLQTIKNHPEYGWSTIGILNNPNLTWEFLKTHKNGMCAGDKEALFNFRQSSKNYARDYALNADLREISEPPRQKLYENITIEKYLDLVDSRCIATLQCDLNSSTNVFPHHVRENPELEWHYVAYATMNPNMTVEFLRELYITIGKRRSLIYSPITNSAFTYDDIVENPDIQWNYKDFGENGSLTFDFILENPTIFDGIDYLNNVSVNEFVAEKATFLERRRREYMAAYQIQQWWMRETSDPRNVVCQRRLEREFDEMFQDTPN